MARGQRGWWRPGPRPGPPPGSRVHLQMEVERLRRELYEEQNLNVNQLGDLTEELAEAKEDLEQERNKTASAVQRAKYWETESQEQSKTIDTLKGGKDCAWELYFKSVSQNSKLKVEKAKADEKNKNLETELLSKTKVEEDLSEKVKELEKKVQEVESKDANLRCTEA